VRDKKQIVGVGRPDDGENPSNLEIASDRQVFRVHDLFRLSISQSAIAEPTVSSTILFLIFPAISLNKRSPRFDLEEGGRATHRPFEPPQDAKHSRYSLGGIHDPVVPPDYLPLLT